MSIDLDFLNNWELVGAHIVCKRGNPVGNWDKLIPVIVSKELPVDTTARLLQGLSCSATSNAVTRRWQFYLLGRKSYLTSRNYSNLGPLRDHYRIFIGAYQVSNRC